jgi:uncharacterized membrane protein
MAEEVKEEKQVSSKEPNVLIAVLTYFIFFLPWLTGDIKDPFVKFHTKQSIVLVIASLIVWILGAVIPVLGWFIIGPVGGLIVFILWLIGVLNALQKKQTPVPWIGQFGSKLNF